MNWTVGKNASIALIIAPLVFLASGWVSYRNIQMISKTEAMVAHTHEVLDALHDVLAKLADAEAGQRTYILTGEPVYLEPYEQAFDALKQRQARLRELTADNSTQQSRLTSLSEMIAVRLITLGEGVTARNSGGLEAGQKFVASGKGRQQMTSIRAQISEIEATEMGLLGERERKSQMTYTTAITTLLVTTLLGLGLVAAVVSSSVREAAAQKRTADVLAQAKEQLEVRVKERTADLAETNEALERSNHELEQFASVASHDLQEPLRKIQAFGDRLQQKCAPELGEQGREYLARMHSSATRMRTLIDALLSYSRVTSKAQPFVPVDLTMIAREVVSDLEERLQTSGSRVEFDSLPTIDADPMQMRQLFQNLLANALKFQKPGVAPVVEIGSRLLPNDKIDNGDGETPPCYEISVRDNGIGFEEVYLDRIFQLFQRLHSRQEFEGTGLGLAICRKIVHRHGGEITARSAPNEGATFLITLPMKQENKEQQNGTSS